MDAVAKAVTRYSAIIGYVASLALGAAYLERRFTVVEVTQAEVIRRLAGVESKLDSFTSCRFTYAHGND